MNNFKFKGIKSGDYEAFCFDVGKSDFTKITGKTPSKFDKSFFNKGKYRIYPSDLMQEIETGEEYNFEISINASK